MTQSEIDRAVSRVTGETRRTIRRYGFSLVDEVAAEPPGDPLLVLDCPGCGAPLDATKVSTGVFKVIECPRCDAVYPFAVDEVYVEDSLTSALAACA